MSPNAIVGTVRQRPFQPLRLHLSGGTHVDVNHPEMIVVGVRTSVVGMPSAVHPELAARYMHVDNLHITHIEPLPFPAPPPNAANGPPA